MEKKVIIKNLKITSLYGTKNYNVYFNEKLTLLYGYNGCGKTTILNILSYMITGDIVKLSKYDFKEASLEYLDSKEKINNFIILKKDQQFIIEYKKNNYIIENFYIRNSEYGIEEIDYKIRSKNKILNEIKDDFNSLYLSLNRITRLSSDYLFDGAYDESSHIIYNRRNRWIKDNYNMIDEVKRLVRDQYKEIFKKLDEYNVEFKNNILKSLISFEIKEEGKIFDQIGKYKFNKIKDQKDKYINILLENDLIKNTDRFDQFFNELLNVNNKDKTEISYLFAIYDLSKMDIVIKYAEQLEKNKERIMKPITIFCDTINEYLNLNKSNKVINIVNGDLIVKDNNGNEIDLEYLSSGEKQLITFYSNLIFGIDSNKPSIIIVDEPELSLHLAWQQIYIKKTLNVSKNVQFIFATHSPEIVGVYRNYLEKVSSEE